MEDEQSNPQENDLSNQRGQAQEEQPKDINNQSEQQDQIEIKTDEQNAEETDANTITDEDRQKMMEALKLIIYHYQQIDERDIKGQVELLKMVVFIKNDLDLPFVQELVILAQKLLQNQNQEQFLLAREIFSSFKKRTPLTKVKEMVQIYHNLCMAEIFSKNMDSGDALMQEAMAFIMKNEEDNSGLMVSGLFRIRSKIFAERSQWVEQAKDLKTAVEILTNVSKENYTDFNDKYIAQITPEIVEIEMEKIQKYDPEQVEKQLLKARALWKAREGEETSDFCHYKNSYLLLSFLFREKHDLSQHQDLIQEVQRNTTTLRSKLGSSSQYMSIFMRTVGLLMEIGAQFTKKEDIKEKDQEVNKDSHKGKDDEEEGEQQGKIQQNEDKENQSNSEAPSS